MRTQTYGCGVVSLSMLRSLRLRPLLGPAKRIRLWFARAISAWTACYRRTASEFIQQFFVVASALGLAASAAIRIIDPTAQGPFLPDFLAHWTGGGLLLSGDPASFTTLQRSLLSEEWDRSGNCPGLVRFASHRGGILCAPSLSFNTT